MPITKYAANLGELAKLLEDLVKMYGADASWQGWDDESIIVNAEDNTVIYIEHNEIKQ